MNNAKERLYNGIIKENPTFVMMLGMCPTLAVTTSAMNGMGMGLTTTAVLILSNVMIALLRNIIPERIRIPSYIVLIATVVTVVELLLKGFLPFLYDSLGIYIPLIVVNCIILGRAEAYASKNTVFNSLFDGIGMGIGFTFALTCIGALREILGTGKIFNYQVMPDGFVPISIFVLAPGAFFVLALLTAIQNRVKIIGNKRGKNVEIIQSGCNLDCMECGEGGCSKRLFPTEELETVNTVINEEPVKIENFSKDSLEKESLTKKKNKTKKSVKKKSKVENQVEKIKTPKNYEKTEDTEFIIQTIDEISEE